MDNKRNLAEAVLTAWERRILSDRNRERNRGDRPMIISKTKKEQLLLGTVTTREADPDGIEQHDDGAKLDSGKPDASLLLMFGKALLAVATVGTLGAKKYTRGGWQQVVRGEERYTAGSYVHILELGDPTLFCELGEDEMKIVKQLLKEKING